MADLTHKAIEDLRAELEQQRTRAEAAEQELRAERERVSSGEWVEKAHAETLEGAADEAQQEVDEVASALGRWKPLTDSVGAATHHLVNELQAMQAKLAAIRAHLVGLDLATLDKDELTSTHAVTNWWEMRKLIAAAREAQAP